ncbi:hypothetical protein [Aliagarivorans marinus]|uniref:hypothetical protein n=1 Tax=Aliagarivorans marinus TaxID=561965 RepID=UPI000400A929|nr:hypothetical protein [Aliagarivorans marinus]
MLGLSIPATSLITRSVVLGAALTLSACSKHYQGEVRFGPEMMAFVECGSDQYWWLGNDSWDATNWSAVMAQINAQPRCDLGDTPCFEQTAYIEAKGQRSKAGSYGHLGIYHYEFTTLEINKAEPSRGQCQ